MPEENKLGERDVDKFIITKPYGTEGGYYPSGLGATIVFGTAKIRYSTENDIFQRVYRNGPDDNHAERQFIRDLEDKLQQREDSVKEIIVNLVQNYSPCHSICVEEIIDFKMEKKKKKIESSWTIKFANFYNIYYERGTEEWKNSWELRGLERLLRNDVTLQLLGGEQDWEEFLDEYVHSNEKTRGLELARSSGRKEREDDDKVIFAYINTLASGKQKTTKLKRENCYWPASSINIALHGT